MNFTGNFAQTLHQTLRRKLGRESRRNFRRANHATPPPERSESYMTSLPKLLKAPRPSCLLPLSSTPLQNHVIFYPSLFSLRIHKAACYPRCSDIP